MNIRKKLLLSIICFVIIPLFIVPIISYYRYKSILEDKINISAQQTLKQVSNNIENVIENMIAATNTLCLDSELLGILQNDKKTTSWERYKNEKKVLDKIIAAQSAVLYPYNSDIVVMDFHGNMYWPYSFPVYKQYKNIVNEDWFKKIKQLNGYMYWMAPLRKYMNISDGHDRNNIAIGRLIKDKNSSKSCGVLVISIEPSMQFGSYFKTDSNFESSSLLLGDSEGNLILSDKVNNKAIVRVLKNNTILNQENGSFKIENNNQKLVVNFYTIPKTGWKLVQVIPYNVLTKELQKLGTFNLGINLIFFFIIILVSYVIAYNITKPLGKLNTLMKKVTQGNFKIRSDVKGNDEIASLSENFNIMVKEIDALIDELKIAYETRSKIRLEALQAQINPHFLLNTLNGVKWMVTMKGDLESSKMISDLGYLLENTIGRNEEMIRLSEELKCIESYVSIQRMRYGNRFSLENEIEERLLDFKVPCLFLQPIVENCIIHGLEDKDENGIIRIKGYSEEKYIKIQISDNGKGMSESEISTIMEIINEDKGRFTNIGVRNVDERIKLIYGNNYGISITSKPGYGTTVEILLPLAGEVEL